MENGYKGINTRNGEKKSPAIKKVGKAIIWIAGIWLGLLIIIQIMFMTSLPTKLVNKYADRFIDGNVTFGDISMSVFSHFPSLGVSMDDFSITYPAQRFASVEKEGVQGMLMRHGCGEVEDTLASFNNLSFRVNLYALAVGKIRIPYVSMDKPRFYIHRYADGSSNLDIFNFTSSEQEEEESGNGIPAMKLGRISFSSHPHVVYTDSKDSIFAMVDFKSLRFQGMLDTRKASRNRIGLQLDSMFVAGRFASDTVAAGLDRLSVTEHHRHMDIEADAKTFAATRTYGRIMIPIGLRAGVSFPKDSVTAISSDHFDLKVASLPLSGRAEVRLHTGYTYIDSEMHIENCDLSTLLKDVVRPFVPQTEKVSTDARLYTDASVKGYYNPRTGELPDVDICLRIPESEIAYADFSKSLKVVLDADVVTDSLKRINASLEELRVRTSGFDLHAEAGVSDLMSEDPGLNFNAGIQAELDTLARVFIPDTMGICAKGFLKAALGGKLKMSQLSLAAIAGADLKGSACCSGVEVRIPNDSIYVSINDMDIDLGPEMRTFGKTRKMTVRMLALTGSIDSTYVNYGNAFEADGKDIVLTAKNVAGANGTIDTTVINPLSIKLSANSLKVKDSESSVIALNRTENRFLVFPKKDHKEIPVMNLTSSNKRIFLKNANNRLILTDAGLKTTAVMNTIERNQKKKAFLDSLARVYPDVPKDSLFRHAMARRKSEPMPAWMKEEDFAKKDLDLKLDETLAKYFREWDIKGNLDVRTGILMTPYFPLRNILKGCGISFDNNKVSIDTFAVAAGDSKIAAKGALTGIKRALLGRKGMLDLNLGIYSDGMDANQLLKAYSIGSKYVPDASRNLENASDAEFLKSLTTEAEQAADTASLFVIPGNINAEINLDARNIKYSDLAVEEVKAKMVMKERCMQIADAKAVTNAGDVSLDAFYSTRSKTDLKAGFDMKFQDITAEKVIALMPAVDSLMPLLKSFRGLLNCEVAATADLDTNMNIIMPSINGVMRISGDNLTVSENEMFRTLARKLLFKNKKTGFIDNMTVEGIIRDNTLEVFPFVLKVDRYTMAMSGIQNLDMSFKYHISVLKSPLLIRLGINLYGNDFDNWKFKLGRAKYKSTNVPVFSSVIDDTKVNLVKSIKGIFEKGVDAAVAENERQQEAIDSRKKQMGFVNAATQELEPLSAKEQEQLEEEEAAQEDITSTMPAVNAVAKAAEEAIEKTIDKKQN